jgi:Secretion system C-terminal sorting domain
MRFRGACNNSALKGNTFYNHNVGLQLTSSAIIGHQGDAGQVERYGNRWVGPFALRGAQHEADLGGLGGPATVSFVGQSTIYYDVSTNSYYPSPQPPAPLYLFKFLAGNTYIPTSITCSTFTAQEGNESNTTDRAIAMNDLDPLEYPEETRWMLRRDLYERLAEDDSLRQDSLFAAFYTIYQSSNFEDFRSTQEGINSLGEMSSADTEEVTEVNNAIQELMEQISLAQQELSDSTINEQDSLFLMQQVVLWKAEIESQRTNISNLLANNATQAIGIGEELRTNNALIETNTQYELNEKVVNDIYLATICREVYTLSEAQKQDLLSIAYQCPLAGGQAVYHARGLYAIVSDSIIWNDDSLCVVVGLQFRHSSPTFPKENKQSLSNISLYPNPAQEEVTIVFHRLRNENQTISLYDVLGKMVANYAVEANKESYILDLHNLPSGVYMLRVGDTQVSIATHKLIISH